MNKKQRVCAALEGQVTDRMPLGFYAVDNDIVSKVLGRPTYFRSRVDFQLALWDGRRDEAVEGWKSDLAEFYKKVDCADILTYRDAQLVPPKGLPVKAPKRIGEDRWEDGEGRVYAAMRKIDELLCIVDPTVPKKEPEDYTEDDFPLPENIREPDESIFELIDYAMEKLGDELYIAGPTGGFTPLPLIGDTYRIGGPSGVLYGAADGSTEVTTYGRQSTIECGLMLYAMAPEVVTAANRQAAAVQDAMDAVFIRAGYDGLIMDRDMGGTNAPLVSPEVFGKCCQPFLRHRVAHAKAQLKSLKPDGAFTPRVIMHNCGNTLSLLPHFIEGNIDGYQSLQTTAGMDIKKLRTMFGDRMAFWGGVPVEDLIGGSPDDVRTDVREVMALYRESGRTGLILGPSQSIPCGTKYENFMTMLDTYVQERDRA